MRPIALFESNLPETPLVKLNGDYGENAFWMKRDDLLPFAFGGNKVRKAAEFYHLIRETGPDVVMTYGSAHSNHCRIVVNMAAAMGLKAHVISPEEDREAALRQARGPFNLRMVEELGAVVETAPLDKIAETIKMRETAYRQEGLKPFFIEGGGHGLPGTLAYVKAYAEILRQERRLGFTFDKIFVASGTGCTQAGLVCGERIDAAAAGKRRRTSRIFGMSIARTNPRGGSVVREAAANFMTQCPELKTVAFTEKNVHFDDRFVCGGYGKYTRDITDLIDRVLRMDGIPLDTTYTGKAFYGMTECLREQNTHKKRVLFIHTGGTPIFFDRLNENV